MSALLQITDPIWITLPDGRRLAAKLWRPNHDRPAPAILEYLPYRRRDGTAPRDATTHPVFAAEGYACIRVDLAGSGDSDGLFDDEYSEQELSDGEAVIAWIAAQDWCDGNVGMIGISWGGFNGLQLAYRRPPALKAVVSVCSTVDRYADDIHYMGGCLLTDNFNWGGQMHAYMTRPPDPAIREDWRAVWLERMEKLPFSAADWLRHPHRDALWQHGSICEDWSAITAPVLSIGGQADAYVNAVPALVEGLGSPTKALLGPWDHKYPHIGRVGSADFHGEVLRWFDRWLGGIKNGVEELPALRAYRQVMGVPSPKLAPREGEWVAETCWPSPNVRPHILHLAEEGLAPAQGMGAREVATPVTMGAASAYFCPGMRIDNELADDQAGDDAQSACFDTPPLGSALDIIGRPELEIAFSVDRPTAQLCARLCEVSPQGVSRRVSYRALNLCHHAGHATPEALVPGQVYRARIPLNMCAHRFEAGNRIRLALSTSYWPVIWPSPAQAIVTLELAECRLILPQQGNGTALDPMPPGPARDYPKYTAEKLRPPASRSERVTDAEGSFVLETFDDFGAQRHAEHGMIEASEVAQRFSLRPDDPLSATHWAQWIFAFERGDWSVRIETENEMTCTAESFHLRRHTRAWEGETLVFDRQQHEEIPRGLL